MRLRLWLVVASALVAASANIPAQQNAPGNAQLLDVPGGKIRVVTVASGLFHPWSVAFTPYGAVLVAERDGRLRIIRNGGKEDEPAWTSPTPRGTAADSLHGLAVHPKFAQNHLVYVSYPKLGPKGNTLAISRGRLEGDKLTELAEIFVADAWETSGNLAGHMMFGPDSTLYVMVGDRDRLCCTGTEDNSLRMKAQGLDSHVGKTLRLKDDGGVPADNPFVGKAGAKPEIFTYGHRNGYGLSIHPQTGELWQAEIGPMGGDEVNILMPGHNYGWPLVSMGRNYTGTLASDQPWYRPGMDNPRMFWVPSISPSSILWYTVMRSRRSSMRTAQTELDRAGAVRMLERRDRITVDQAALMHDLHAIADAFHLRQNMRRQDHAVRAAELADQRADLADLVRIEPHRRLVENDHVRAVHDGLGDAHALLIAAR